MPNVPRGDEGWEGSHLNHVITLWPDREFKKKMRLSRVTFQDCFYATAGHAHIAESTARKYVMYTCEAIIENLVPVYMRPPTAMESQQSQRVFATRLHMGNIGLAVDGTHIPWQPDCHEWMDEFRNYEGWYSILVVALVNGLGMFVDVEIGHTGRSSDSTVTYHSTFMQEILADREKWLGSPDGLLISDGAFSMGRVVLTPYPMPHGGGVLEEYQRWFNFCFSSTRIVVEQVFGIWKSTWRMLLKEPGVGRHFLSMMRII
eukprot:jgi/Tetstr1/462005/TSEL_007076.t1